MSLYTTPCVDMSVSVCPDPSLWEEIGFVILHHKSNEINQNAKRFFMLIVSNFSLFIIYFSFHGH